MFLGIIASIIIVLTVSIIFDQNTKPAATSTTSTSIHRDVLVRGKNLIEEAMKDPEKARMLRCLGVSTSDRASLAPSNEAQCQRILVEASTTSQNQARPVLTNGGLTGSPAAREYVATMLNFQYSLELAYNAGICQLRNETYFRTFQAAQSRLSHENSRRLNLSGAELGRADAEVNRQIAKAHEGAPQFDINKGCEFLRNSSMLVDLDAMYRAITTNYR